MRPLSTVPVKNVNPHGWKSWQDVPDTALPKCPDPTNQLYETKEYKTVQKKRVWYQVGRFWWEYVLFKPFLFQIDDGTPIYFKDGLKDRVIVYTYVTMVFSLLAYEYYLIATEVAVWAAPKKK